MKLEVPIKVLIKKKLQVPTTDKDSSSFCKFYVLLFTIKKTKNQNPWGSLFGMESPASKPGLGFFPLREPNMVLVKLQFPASHTSLLYDPRQATWWIWTSVFLYQNGASDIYLLHRRVVGPNSVMKGYNSMSVI